MGVRRRPKAEECFDVVVSLDILGGAPDAVPLLTVNADLSARDFSRCEPFRRLGIVRDRLVLKSEDEVGGADEPAALVVGGARLPAAEVEAKVVIGIDTRPLRALLRRGDGCDDISNRLSALAAGDSAPPRPSHVDLNAELLALKKLVE